MCREHKNIVELRTFKSLQNLSLFVQYNTKFILTHKAISFLSPKDHEGVILLRGQGIFKLQLVGIIYHLNKTARKE